MSNYIPKKGDEVWTRNKAGLYVVLRMDKTRAVADIQIGNNVGPIYKGVPFSELRPAGDNSWLARFRRRFF